MATRFKCDINCCTFCVFLIFKACESVSLRMKLTVFCVPALPDDLTVLHDNRTHKRIRIYETCSPFCKFRSLFHINFVLQTCQLISPLKNKKCPEDIPRHKKIHIKLHYGFILTLVRTLPSVLEFHQISPKNIFFGVADFNRRL